jgi:hypothetical protein
MGLRLPVKKAELIKFEIKHYSTAFVAFVEASCIFSITIASCFFAAGKNKCQEWPLTGEFS